MITTKSNYRVTSRTWRTSWSKRKVVLPSSWLKGVSSLTLMSLLPSCGSMGLREVPYQRRNGHSQARVELRSCSKTTVVRQRTHLSMALLMTLRWRHCSRCSKRMLMLKHLTWTISSRTMYRCLDSWWISLRQARWWVSSQCFQDRSPILCKRVITPANMTSVITLSIINESWAYKVCREQSESMSISRGKK